MDIHLLLFSLPLQLQHGPNLTAVEFSWAQSRLTQAVQLMNGCRDLTVAERAAIGQITSFTVAGHNDYLGATGCHGETLSSDYISACSVAWLASLFAHEGCHHLNTGLWKGEEAWRDEQSAGRMQLEVGVKLGFTPGERSYLEGWTADSNQARMQQHMRQGLRG